MPSYARDFPFQQGKKKESNNMPTRYDNGVISLRDLDRILKEESSKNEFKAVVGPKVDSENSKNNKKAVNDIMNDVKKNDGSSSTEKRHTDPENVKDYNRTTLDAQFKYEPSKDYTDRVKAQVHGFPSVENEKLHEKEKQDEKNGSLEYDTNKEFYDDRKSKMKDISKAMGQLKHAGLKGRELPDDLYKSGTLFNTNENKERKMKRLIFKHTKFLSEEAVMNRIPSEYRAKEGRFYMQDCTGTDYLCECKINPQLGISEVSIISRRNLNEEKEQLKKMKELYSYKSSDYSGDSTASERLTEDKNLSKMLGLVRRLEESKK